MPEELAAWLLREREARGWDRPEMARQLITAGKTRGDKHMPAVKNLTHNIYRWEHGDGVSRRYVLAYCLAFRIEPSQFPHPDGAVRGRRKPAGAAAAAADVPAAEDELFAAAHDGSEHAGRAEERGIGDTTLEQLRADMTGLSRDYMTADPFPLFREMRRVRDRMHGALGRRIWPRDTAEIYFLLGCVNGLMACAAADLGYPSAAAELARAGWTYATVIGHRPLLAKLRLDLASLSYWGGGLQRAADLARDGLEYLSAGPVGVQLHLRYGHAAALLGDAGSARNAIAAAWEARDGAYGDDLTAMGGEFDLSQATAEYLVGGVLMEIPGAEAEAAAQLERAAKLYAAGPDPGETHGHGAAALAGISLAEARLRAGSVDGAAEALAPVLDLPESRRIDPIPQRLTRVRGELARHACRGSVQARDLAGRIEAFGRAPTGVG